MAIHRVIWEMDVDVIGDHVAAAQSVAKRHFAKHIADGVPGSSCVFTVITPKGKRELVDLSDITRSSDGSTE